MASGRVTFAVSATPIYQHTAAEGTTAREVVHGTFDKRLAGSGEVDSLTYAVESLANVDSGDSAYASILNAANLSTITSFLYIKHRGVDDAGDATTDTVRIRIGTQPICELKAGEAIVLPRPDVAGAVDVDAYGVGGIVSMEVGEID